MTHGRSRPSVRSRLRRLVRRSRSRTGPDCSSAARPRYAGLTKPEFGALEFRAAHPNRINYVRLSPVNVVQYARTRSVRRVRTRCRISSAHSRSGLARRCRRLRRSLHRTRWTGRSRKLKPGEARPPPSEPLDDASAPDVVVFAGDTTPALPRFAGPCARRGTNPPPSSARTGFSTARGQLQARIYTGQARLQPEPMPPFPRSRRQERTSSMPIERPSARNRPRTRTPRTRARK